MNVRCPQCGGDIQLRETAGFVGCPFCGASLILDLTGIRCHYLFRPRYGPGDLLPLLRRWCDRAGQPSPRLPHPPRLIYYPFWRYVRAGRPRLLPAWPTLEPRWADVRVPDAEQVFFSPAEVAGAQLVEAGVPEGAARDRLRGEEAGGAGDLVHAPFLEGTDRLGKHHVPLSVDACSGRVYAESPSAAGEGPAAPRVMAGRLAWGATAMLAEVVVLPPALAIPTLLATGVLTFWRILAGTRRGMA